MNKQQWLDKVKADQSKLRRLIALYHPSSHDEEVPEPLPITAPNSEATCQVFRDSIRKHKPVNPLIQFDVCITGNDWRKLYSLLEQTWIGVPESKECWGIPGFSEAVELLDNPPETEDDV